MSEAVFIGAQLFEKGDLWDLLKEETKKAGGHVAPMVEKFIAAREVCAMHPTIFHGNKQMISFPHTNASGSFDNFSKLTDHFKSLTEKERNYATIKQRPGDAQVMMNQLLRQKCVKIVDPKDLDKLTLNPANILDRSGGKTQLLVHGGQNNA